MKKLTKYTSFDSLKAGAKSRSLEDSAKASEFEAFLNYLRKKFFAKNRAAIQYGKKSR